MQIFISRNGQQLGPYTLDIINAGLSAGSFGPDDLAWYEGAAAWAPLSTLPGVVIGVRSPPPPVFAAQAAQPEGAKLASRGSRLGAAVLDGVIFFASVLPGIIICAATREGGGFAFGVLLLLAGFIGLGIVNVLLLMRRGQTLAKRIVGIRIVKVSDESNPGFVKIWLLRSLVTGLIGAIPYLGWIFTLVDACFIFREDRRCIHDLIAETKVIVAGD